MTDRHNCSDCQSDDTEAELGVCVGGGVLGGAYCCHFVTAERSYYLYLTSQLYVDHARTQVLLVILFTYLLIDCLARSKMLRYKCQKCVFVQLDVVLGSSQISHIYGMITNYTTTFRQETVPGGLNCVIPCGTRFQEKVK